jgi:hypothetical protein
MVEIIFSRQQGGEKAVRTVDVPAGPRRHPGDSNLSWNFSILGGGVGIARPCRPIMTLY